MVLGQRTPGVGEVTYLEKNIWQMFRSALNTLHCKNKYIHYMVWIDEGLAKQKILGTIN